MTVRILPAELSISSEILGLPLENVRRFSKGTLAALRASMLVIVEDREKTKMLEIIIVILIILWLIGFFVVHIGSFIHILLILALIVFVVRMLRGSRAV